MAWNKFSPFLFFDLLEQDLVHWPQRFDLKNFKDKPARKSCVILITRF